MDSIVDLKQVVILGTELDRRSLTQAGVRLDVTFFAVEQPATIAGRQWITAGLPNGFTDRRVLLEAAFPNDDVHALVNDQPRFDTQGHTMFIYEGCSTCFTEQESQRMMQLVQFRLREPQSNTAAVPEGLGQVYTEAAFLQVNVTVSWQVTDTVSLGMGPTVTLGDGA